MRTTGVVSVKMPTALKERIDELAHKGLITRNRWIVNVLSQRARWGRKEKSNAKDRV